MEKKTKLKYSAMNKDFKLTEVKLKGKLKAQIYDNCLPLNEFEEMQKQLLSSTFPYFYYKEIVEKEKYNIKSPVKGYGDNKDVDVCQFVHLFFYHEQSIWSQYVDLIRPILNVINPRAWIRVKCNLGIKEQKHLVGGWHYDILQQNGKPYDDTITGVLHLNTNNGYTLMETGQKVESVANRLVLFPCNVLHTNITHTDIKARALLNFNFLATT